MLTDIEMPRMGGLELAAALNGRGLRVIILTTFARPATFVGPSTQASARIARQKGWL